MNPQHRIIVLFFVIICTVLYLIIHLEKMEYPLQMNSKVQPKREDKELQCDKRNENLKNVCKTFNYGRKETNIPFLSNRTSEDHTKEKCRWANCPVIIDDAKKIAFCFIPKVSSTIFKIQFLRSKNNTLGSRFYSLSSNISKNFHIKANDILHRTSISFHTYTKFKKFFNIIFVRHPFNRLVSAYKNKMERRGLNMFTKPLINVMKKNRKVNILSSKDWPTFKEFVLYLLENDPSKYNEHWIPYYIRCDPCKIQYDFIGKMEAMDAGLKYLGVKLNLNISNTRMNSSSRKSSLMFQYFSQLTVKELKGLYEIYRKDFELFGYNIDQVFVSRIPTD